MKLQIPNQFCYAGIHECKSGARAYRNIDGRFALDIYDKAGDSYEFLIYDTAQRVHYTHMGKRQSNPKEIFFLGLIF